MQTKYGQGVLSPEEKQQQLTSTHGNELSEQEEEQLINGRRYQQGIEYIHPGTRSGLIDRHKIKYKDQQAIEYIRPCMRSMCPGTHIIKHKDQQAIEYIRPCVRSIRPGPHILKYDDQQGIKYIRGAERSMCYKRQGLHYIIQEKHGHIYT